MDWSSEGFILSVRKHGESSAIVNILTPDKGRHAGLVRGGSGRRMRPVLQPGNYVRCEWRSRLSEHLGYFTIEPVDAWAAQLMENRQSLSGLNSLCAMALETLPEREAHPRVFDAFRVVVENLDNEDIWPALYIRWEAGLLSAMGYGMDLSRCAATGETEHLTHVSPRSGRAVSADAAEPYRDKMLSLPGFLLGQSGVTPVDILHGLSLTGYFLETRLQWGVNRTLPDARGQMITRLIEAGIAKS